MAASLIPILMYHRLGRVRDDSIVPGHYVSEALFESHLRLIRRLRMTTISLAELANGFAGISALPKRPIVITFDDGYESFYRIGLPLLEKYRMKASVFVVSDRVGGVNQWDLAKGDVEEPLMSRAQVHEAAERGIEIGSHSCGHVSLTNVSAADAEDEITRSRSDLQALLGRPVDFFCYPYGDQDGHIRRLVQRAGYRAATWTKRHGNSAATDRFTWGRINVRFNVSAWKLAWRIFQSTRG